MAASGLPGRPCGACALMCAPGATAAPGAKPSLGAIRTMSAPPSAWRAGDPARRIAGEGHSIRYIDARTTRSRKTCGLYHFNPIGIRGTARDWNPRGFPCANTVLKLSLSQPHSCLSPAGLTRSYPVANFLDARTIVLLKLVLLAFGVTVAPALSTSQTSSHPHAISATIERQRGLARHGGLVKFETLGDAPRSAGDHVLPRC